MQSQHTHTPPAEISHQSTCRKQIQTTQERLPSLQPTNHSNHALPNTHTQTHPLVHLNHTTHSHLTTTEPTPNTLPHKAHKSRTYRQHRYHKTTHMTKTLQCSTPYTQHSPPYTTPHNQNAPHTPHKFIGTLATHKTFSTA